MVDTEETDDIDGEDAWDISREAGKQTAGIEDVNVGKCGGGWPFERW